MFSFSSKLFTEDVTALSTSDIFDRVTESFRLQHELVAAVSDPSKARSRDLENFKSELKKRHVLLEQLMVRDAKADDAGGILGDCTLLERELLTSDVMVEKLILTLTSAVALLERLPLHPELNQAIADEGEIVTMVVQGVCSHRRRRSAEGTIKRQTVAFRVAVVLPDAKLLIRLLSPALSFLTRYNACRLFGSLVSHGGVAFLAQVVDSGTGLTHVNHMLQCIDQDNLLRHAALQLVLTLTDPKNFTSFDCSGPRSCGEPVDASGFSPGLASGYSDEEDEVGKRSHDLLVAIQCLLAFDGCYEHLFAIMDDEGGLYAPDRTQLLNDVLLQLTIPASEITDGAFYTHDVMSRGSGAAGRRDLSEPETEQQPAPRMRISDANRSMSTVADCVRCITQLLVGNEQTTGLFIRMEYVGKLQNLLALPASCAEFPSEGLVFPPPFSRPCATQRSLRSHSVDSASSVGRTAAANDNTNLRETVGTATEEVYVGVSFILLHCTQHAVSRESDRTLLVKHLMHHSKIIDHMISWICYLANVHMRGSRCFVSPSGLCMLWNLIYVVDYALLRTGASRRGMCDFVLQKESAVYSTHSASGWGPDFGPGMNTFLGIPATATLRTALMLLVYWRRHASRAEYPAVVNVSTQDSQLATEGDSDYVACTGDAEESLEVAVEAYEELLSTAAQAALESIIFASADDSIGATTLVHDLLSFPVPRRMYAADGVYYLGLAAQRMRALGTGAQFFSQSDPQETPKAVTWLQYLARYLHHVVAVGFSDARNVSCLVATAVSVVSIIDAYVEGRGKRQASRHEGSPAAALPVSAAAAVGEEPKQRTGNGQHVNTSHQVEAPLDESVEQEVVGLVSQLLDIVAELERANQLADRRIIAIVRSAAAATAAQLIIHGCVNAQCIDKQLAKTMGVTRTRNDAPGTPAGVSDPTSSSPSSPRSGSCNSEDCGYGSTVANVFLVGCSGDEAPITKPGSFCGSFTSEFAGPAVAPSSGMPLSGVFDAKSFWEFAEQWRQASAHYCAINGLFQWLQTRSGLEHAGSKLYNGRGDAGGTPESAGDGTARKRASAHTKEFTMETWYRCWVDYFRGREHSIADERWRLLQRNASVNQSFTSTRAASTILTDRWFLLLERVVACCSPHAHLGSSPWGCMISPHRSQLACVGYARDVIGEPGNRGTTTTRIPEDVLMAVFADVHELDAASRRRRAHAAISSTHATEISKVATELETAQGQLAELGVALAAKDDVIAQQRADIEALCQLLVSVERDHMERVRILRKAFTG